MERRKFIALLGVGAGICIVPPALYMLAPGTKEYAAQIIEKELFYLKIRKSDIVKYVDDYFMATSNNLLSNIKWKTTYYLRLDYNQADRLRDLLKYFLLSTDFFINKTDESRPVRYLGLYSPYKSPVPNPYSFVIYPPSEMPEP